MKNRAADASIRGYQYQFNHTILELLNAGSNETITIEGIEDIDVMTSGETGRTIQCKYLAAQKYTPSRIRAAIIAMLDHFRSAPTDIHYTLYAHFSNKAEGSLVFSIEDLKNILVYVENKKEVDYIKKYSLSEANLKKFVSRLTIKFGTTIEQQCNKIRTLLENSLACSSTEADVLLYPQCLATIFEFATKTKASERRIKRELFLTKIQRSEVLFDTLYERFLGTQKHKNFIKAALKKKKALSSTKYKLLFLSDETSAFKKPSEIAKFVQALVHKYFRHNHSQYDAEPWTICLQVPKEKLIEVKTLILNHGITLNDGFENISFSSTHFNKSPFISRKDLGKSTKIADSSYQVRIIGLNTLLENLEKIKTPDSIFSIGVKLDPQISSSQQWDLFNLSSSLSVSDTKEILLGA